MEIFFITFVILTTFFILTHLRPLNEGEIVQLSKNRRYKKIKKYFSFIAGEYKVDKNFKKQMNPNGKFYQIREDLRFFPSVAAGLLKYKKHEWIIIAFEKDRIISKIWLNKGSNRASVPIFLSIQNLINVSKKDRYNSVMIFHNHPNSDPNYYNCNKPSSTDVKLAKEYGYELKKNGINLLEFVCERGKHYRYYTEYSDNFFHVSDFIKEVNTVKNQSKSRNFLMHFERIFL